MRTVFMAYLTDSIKAVDFYCKAFKASSRNCFKDSDEDDFYAHAEIVINEQIVLAISDTLYYNTDFKTGNNMQFWLTFDDRKALDWTYDVLKQDAQIIYTLGPCEWCSQMADLIDRFGVRWLLNCDC